MTTQGAQTQNGNVLDLDALLAKRLLKPKPVKLGGYTYQVRTDLTGEQVTKYFELVNSDESVKALTLLVGATAAKKLYAALEKLPREHMNLAIQEFMIAAGIVVGTSKAESEGE